MHNCNNAHHKLHLMLSQSLLLQKHVTIAAATAGILHQQLLHQLFEKHHDPDLQGSSKAACSARNTFPLQHFDTSSASIILFQQGRNGVKQLYALLLHPCACLVHCCLAAACIPAFSWCLHGQHACEYLAMHVKTPETTNSDLACRSGRGRTHACNIAQC